MPSDDLVPMKDDTDGISDEEMKGIASAPIDGIDEPNVEPLPIADAMRFACYARGRNEQILADGDEHHLITKEALIKTVTAERLLRHWGREDMAEEMSRIDRKLQSRWVTSVRRNDLESRREELAKRRDDLRGMTLWDFASGRKWELFDATTWEGNHVKVIEGTFLALTEAGEQAYGSEDGMFPLWEIMSLLEATGLEDCDELLCERALRRMTEQGLAYDLCD